MRNTFIYIGIVALVVIVGLMINRGFTLSQETTDMAPAFSLSSSAFAAQAFIPPVYTCDGGQASPPLSIANPPEGTKTFALIVEDPDVPKQLRPDGVFLHWVLFNIPGDTKDIQESTKVGVSGANGTGKNAYAGPCPPPQYEPSTHRYVFTLYALDTELPLATGASKAQLLKAMEGHILGEAELIGVYKKVTK